MTQVPINNRIILATVFARYSNNRRRLFLIPSILFARWLIMGWWCISRLFLTHNRLAFPSLPPSKYQPRTQRGPIGNLKLNELRYFPISAVPHSSMSFFSLATPFPSSLGVTRRGTINGGMACLMGLDLLGCQKEKRPSTMGHSEWSTLLIHSFCPLLLFSLLTHHLQSTDTRGITILERKVPLRWWGDEELEEYASYRISYACMAKPTVLPNTAHQPWLLLVPFG